MLKYNQDILCVFNESTGEIDVELIPISDHDGDTLPAQWENLYGLNDNDASDALLDNDNDGLTNVQEYSNKTNPNVSDTDGDGLLDGFEVVTSLTNPLDYGYGFRWLI